MTAEIFDLLEQMGYARLHTYDDVTTGQDDLLGERLEQVLKRLWTIRSRPKK